MKLKNETYTVEIFADRDRQFFQISSTVSMGATHEVKTPENIGNLLAEYIKADSIESDEKTSAIAINSTDRKNFLSLQDNINDIKKLISKCTAAADMFEEALRYGESRPTDMDIYPDMAKVISEYGYKAKSAIKQLEKDFVIFRNEITERGIDT